MNRSLQLVAGLLASASFATIAHAGEVAGHVSDSTGNRPLQSASVRIVELNRQPKPTAPARTCSATCPQARTRWRRATSAPK